MASLGFEKLSHRGQELIVKSPEADDIPHLQDFYRHIFDESDFFFPSGKINRTTDEWQTLISGVSEAPHSLIVLIYLQGNLVGFGNLIQSPIEVFKFNVELGTSVRANFRGQGLGQVLIDSMIRFAKEKSQLRRVNISVVSENKSAIQLYQKNGFQTEGVRKKSVFSKGRFYDEMLMGLLLEWQ